VVSYSDAVVDPRTVVVIPVNASMAYDTMAGSPSSYCFAFWAEGLAVKCLQQFKEFDFLIL
jgi:hypothetical protein